MKTASTTEFSTHRNEIASVILSGKSRQKKERPKLKGSMINKWLISHATQ